MTHSGGIAVALVLAGTTTLMGCETGRVRDLLLKAPVHRLPAAVRQAYPDLGPADSLQLRLEGEWFDEPRDLPLIPRAAADLASPVSASQAAYAAFKRGDDDWILASFAETDREEIRGLLADSTVRAGSRSYYSTVTQHAAHGWARYVRDSTEYRLVFVSERTSADVQRVEAFVQEAGEWRRTNRLSRDREFRIAWIAYRYGRITPQ